MKSAETTVIDLVTVYLCHRLNMSADSKCTLLLVCVYVTYTFTAVIVSVYINIYTISEITWIQYTFEMEGYVKSTLFTVLDTLTIAALIMATY